MVLGEEDGWVIEHYLSDVCEPEYWDGIGWSKDHLKAVRFSRHRDAVRVRDAVLIDDRHRVAEHGWG